MNTKPSDPPKPSRKKTTTQKTASQQIGNSGATGIRLTLPGLDAATMSAMRKNMVRELLRKNFTEYFVQMTTQTDQWPSISNEEFIAGVADSFMEMGKQRNMGIVLLQTLVYELQERVNAELAATSGPSS